MTASVASRHPDPDALLAFVPAAARRVLDCGCGDGTRARALRDRGIPEILCVPAPGEEPHNREDFPCAFLLDPASPQLPADIAPFDVILCQDTLARLRDPEPLLAAFRDALHPGGLIIATAPNLQHHQNVLMLAQGRWTQGTDGALARKHLRFFTAIELIRLFERAGFAQAKCTPLVEDPPEAFPRDDTRTVRTGRFTIGPLSDREYRAWLTREYLVLAAR